MEALKKEVEEERAKAREAARERVLLDFERGQLGLGSSSAAGSGVGGKAQVPQNGEKESTDHDESKPSGYPLDTYPYPAAETGTKRKLPTESTPFTFSASAASTLAEEAEQAALKKIEIEQAERMKAKLPDFWLPSLTPTCVIFAAFSICVH